MLRLEGRPSDERGFIHKRLLGIGAKLAGTLIPGVSTGISIVRGLVGGGGGPQPPGQFPLPARNVLPREITARPSLATAQGKESGRALKFAGDGAGPGGGGPCADPRLVRAADGHCVAPGSGHFLRHFPGQDGSAQPVGDAVMGRFGAGLQPGIMQIARAVCLRGMVLAVDGLCYNKSQISNKQRQWPRGRRPLLTGGDMRAIGIASRAGTKLDRTTKRLRDLGMMKQLPRPRKAKGHAHAAPVAAVSV